MISQLKSRLTSPPLVILRVRLFAPLGHSASRAQLAAPNHRHRDPRRRVGAASYCRAAAETYIITYRLKDLETRLDPGQFVRLGRGALANLEMLRRVSPMPGGTYVATLSNGQRLSISRLQGRILREHLLKL
jgi:LytTr DNA-binding domain-containing protein